MASTTVNHRRQRKVYRWLNRLYTGLLPMRCRFCASPGTAGMELCGPCAADLPWLDAHCWQCALPLSNAGERLCGGCLNRPPPFSRVLAPFRYTRPIDTLIKALKYGEDLAAARLLADLLAEHLRQRSVEAPEAVVPVPLHPLRLRERGFNQALELARSLDAPISTGTVRRIRDTAAQSSLGARDRRRNIRGAFRVTTVRMPAHIAVIDDVLTTGATVSELARTLRRAGAQRVEIWVVARTNQLVGK